jgi:hypothetical protein
VPVVVLLERAEQAVPGRAQHRRGHAGQQRLVQRPLVRRRLGPGAWSGRHRSFRWHLKEFPDPHEHLQVATAPP